MTYEYIGCDIAMFSDGASYYLQQVPLPLCS